MSMQDEIFRKHLENIREELDWYIESHLPIFECKRFASVRESAPIAGGVLTTGSAKKIPDMLRRDSECPELDEVLARKEESFSEMLLRMIDEKRLKDSEVYKRANIDRRLFSKIRSDEDYVPSKKTAISFCMALQLDPEETKKLLATAGYTLSTSSRFDLIIQYLIEKGEYNIHFANLVLDDYGEGTLSR